MEQLYPFVCLKWDTNSKPLIFSMSGAAALAKRDRNIIFLPKSKSFIYKGFNTINFLTDQNFSVAIQRRGMTSFEAIFSVEDKTVENLIQQWLQSFFSKYLYHKSSRLIRFLKLDFLSCTGDRAEIHYLMLSSVG